MNYTSLTVIAGAIAMGWSRIKSFYQWVSNLIIVEVRLSGVAGVIVSRYIYKKARKSPFAPIHLDAQHKFVKKEGRVVPILFEIPPQETNIFWYGHTPLFFGRAKGKSSRDKHGEKEEDATLSFFRGTFDYEKFVVAASQDYRCLFSQYNNVDYDQSGVSRRFTVRRLSGQGSVLGRRAQENGPNMESAVATSGSIGFDRSAYTVVGTELVGAGKLLEFSIADLGEQARGNAKLGNRLVYDASVLSFMEDIRFWYGSREWYSQKNISWRFSAVLYGPGGCGKTSLPIAIAEELDMPLYAFDLGSMSNEELYQNWDTVRANTPAVVVFEDIDNVFNGRENRLKEMGGGLSFDCLLNVLSGVQNNDGILMIATTNNISTLDPALGIPVEGEEMSSRPGRFDRAIFMGAINKENMLVMAKRILTESDESEIDQVIKDSVGKNYTPAQFESKCVAIALRKKWKTHTKE